MRLTIHSYLKRIRDIGAVPFIIMGLVFLITASAAEAYTVTPSTWNIIGLDSNTPASGPYRFPVGAKVCGGVLGASDTVTFTWESGGTDNGTYIYERPGSAFPNVNITFGADGCADAYFEVEVNRNGFAYNNTRRYYITAGGVSTPRPRELFVERLVSQSRNYVYDVKLNGASVPAGGSMTLMVGNTYDIKLVSKTATQGYEQLETFINFPNTIFQVLSVKTTYSADTTSNVPLPSPDHDYLYADGCGWENDPNSPNYRACNGDGKAGGDITTTYTVKILSGGGTSQTLSSLIYDFSGSSFHYNADYSTGYRIANIVGPSSCTINKSFSPKAISPGGTSTMTIKLTNPTSETFTGVNFADSAGWPAGLTVSSPGTTTVCGGSLVTTANSVSFSGGTLSPNSVCTINITVTAAIAGTYPNTTGNLYISTNIDTTNYGSDTLTASSAPACIAGQTLASWKMDPTSTSVPPPYTTKAGNVNTATASTPAGINSTIDTTTGSAAAYSWQASGYKGSASFTTADNDYVEFVIDTSKYEQVGMSYNYNSKSNGPTNLYVYYDKGSGLAGPQATFNSVADAIWHSSATIDFTGLTSTSSTTIFRIYGFNANCNSSGCDLNLDDITFTGCAVPTPAPTISKSFLSDPIIKGATSTLRFTINNTSAGNLALTGMAFTDVLPAGLSVADSTTSQCGGTNNFVTTASTRTLALTGGSLAAGGSCTIDVTVTGTTEGQYENVTGYISSTQSGTSTNYATDTLTVVAPPVIAKSFDPTSIYTSSPGNTSTLTFTITNPNLATALSGVGFTDTLPAGLTIVDFTSSQCGGTNNLTTTAATRVVALTGGTLAANSSCTFNITVTGTTAGTKSSTSTAVTSTEGGNGNTASASVVVSDRVASIDLMKHISTSSGGPWGIYVGVSAGSTVYYRFKVYNSGDLPLYNIGITETEADPDINIASIDCSSVPSPLNPGYDGYCYASDTAAAGSHANIAEAHGEYPSGGTTYNSGTSNSATYATTGLTIAKSATKLNSVSFTGQPYFTAADDILTYGYTVTNTGSATLLGPITVSDNKSTDESCPAVSTGGDNDNYFDPGESITCTATYTVTAADVTAKSVTNTASATTSSNGYITSVTSNTDSETVPLAADMSVTKANDVGGEVAMGSSFVWTLTVANAAAAGSVASFADTQTLLTDDLPTSGATYSVGSITLSGGAIGTISCAISSNTLNCAASGTVTIPAGGSFSVPVTVTPTAAGSLVNPKGGGICMVDSSTLVPEIDETNNDCAQNTVTVTGGVSLTVIKSVQVISDPFNGTTNPKAIPGAEMLYTILVTNTGAGTVDIDTMVITDPVPANMSICVSTLCNNPPVDFYCSIAPACGLTYNYAADVTYSNQVGGVAPYDYVPAAPNIDAAGYDSTVTGVRLNPKSSLNGSNANFSLFLKMTVK